MPVIDEISVITDQYIQQVFINRLIQKGFNLIIEYSFNRQLTIIQLTDYLKMFKRRNPMEIMTHYGKQLNRMDSN